MRNIVAQGDADQAQSDFVSHRENKNLALRRAKQEEIKAAGGKISKQRLKSNIKSNRAREASLVAEMICPTTRAPKSRKPNPGSVAEESVVASSEAASIPAGPTLAAQAESTTSPSLASQGGGEDSAPSVSSAASGAIVAHSLAALRARRRQEA